MLFLCFCRADLLRAFDSWQFLPIMFSNNKVQTRPPFAVQFEYSHLSCSFNFSVLPVHTIPDPSRSHTTREEINSLKDNLYDLLNFPCCSSKNAIILGDFNQGSQYVGTNWRSDLDQDAKNIKEIMYTGSSTVANKPNQLDRYENNVHEHYNFLAFFNEG